MSPSPLRRSTKRLRSCSVAASLDASLEEINRHYPSIPVIGGDINVGPPISMTSPDDISSGSTEANRRQRHTRFLRDVPKTHFAIRDKTVLKKHLLPACSQTPLRPLPLFFDKHERPHLVDHQEGDANLRIHEIFPLGKLPMPCQ